MTWLPAGFAHPLRLDLPTGHHLRPIRAADAELDLPAVLGSRERLWSIYGEAWGWPPADLTLEEDREDLARHEREIEAHESFDYALFDEEETELLGCVYIDPTDLDPALDGALVSWWVVDRLAGTEVEAALDAAVPAWLERDWPLAPVRYGVA